MSRGWKTILFDLDGTLTDPKEGITQGIARALAHYGIHEEPDNLSCFIGPPLTECFISRYGFSEKQCEEAVQVFRVYFNDRGWAENRPYDGIEALLSRLKDAGKQLAVATTKPEGPSKRILTHFGLADYFDLICGTPDHAPVGWEKSRIVEDALKRAGVTDLDTAVMVGDRKFDIIGAHAKGLSAIGVLYGYGDRAELEECGADYITENPQSLGALLLE